MRVKEKLRIIGIGLAVTLVAGYLVGSVVWFSLYDEGHTCQHVRWEITDRAERQYVTIEELENTLKDAGLKIKSEQARGRGAVELQKIEETLKKHPMIRTAECYNSEEGEVYIRISQRRPILRVLTGVESYLVDSDHKRMQVRASITDPMPVAEGNIGIRMATNELARFAEWLRDDAYWQPRIQRIHVRTPHYIELIERKDDRDVRIIVDGLDKVEKQLERVRKFEAGIEKLAEKKEYRELDVRFDGQVVGRK